MTSLLQQRIAELVEQHGSLRAAAPAMGVSHVYLHRLGTGEMSNPSDELLSKLRLRRTIVDEQDFATDDEIVAWADSFIREHAYNRPVAVQIAIEAAKWVRARIAGVPSRCSAHDRPSSSSTQSPWPRSCSSQPSRSHRA